MVKGGKEFLMRAHFGLPSVENHELEGRPPITVQFEIPYFTVSSIQVRFMKIIEKSGYQALPWVRYITQSGDDQLMRRMPAPEDCTASFWRKFMKCFCVLVDFILPEFH